MLWPEVVDVGVGRDLEAGNSGCEDDECREEESEGGDGCGGEEEKRSGCHDEQTDDHGLLVASPLDELASGEGEDEVGGEEGELHQHDLSVVELEDALEVGDEDVVETGEESPHEEEHGRDAHRPLVGSLIDIWSRRCCCDCA